MVSWINLRLPELRRLISGSPKIIIRNGCIERDIMRELRFSVDDLLMALRSKDIFDIGEVQYAIVETTGSVSVMKKQPLDTPTRQDMKIAAECSEPPVLIIADGKFIPQAMESVKLSKAAVEMLLSANKMVVNDVFIMTADSSGSYFIADKQGTPPMTVTLGEKK
jgi:uncharacterized membrane protein YcaP (DUF421 family)